MKEVPKKKILIFNGFYYPSKNCGGPVTSIENIVNSCSDEFDFHIVCYNHDWNDSTPFDKEVNTWHKVGKAKVMYVPDSYLDFSIKKMRNILASLNPDLIWFSGILTPNNKIVASICGKKMRIPVLFSPRGEVSADRISIKWYKKIPYLKLINLLGIYDECYFHGTSEDEIEGLNRFFHPSKNHIAKVPNISILQQPDVTEYHKEEGTLKAMFFSRIHEVKNLLYAVKCVCKCKQRIIFDIYGPIESEEYWDECMKEYQSAKDNITINYKGILSKAEMRETIQSHDCFIFPTINENYGHVIAESLANSRPVILSKGTTPWDDLNDKAGYAIDLDKPEEFISKIDYYASLGDSAFAKIIASTKEYFINKTLSDGAIEGHKKMFTDIIQDYHQNKEDKHSSK